MIIQRIQSLYLLIATVLSGFFCVSSIGSVKVEETLMNVYPKDNPVMLIVGILITLLLFISIFLFKDLKRQKTIALLSMFLIIATEATVFILIFSSEAGMISWTGGALLLLGSFIFTLLAYRGINKDQKILRESDRIR
ncbi:MAG: DUF4293 domain-containing protein [Muribaculaceae bacterium]|nr:DUF4293 domain-containing protein [Muribaculaceae bacterium]MDE5844426.1 DUF4293 domain-containing protein [Muribaculaceae bacterium]